MTLDLLTVSEAATELRVSAASVYRALEEGRMPGSKPFGRWRIPRGELEEWVNAQRPHSVATDSADPMPRPGQGGRFRAEVIPLGSRRSG